MVFFWVSVSGGFIHSSSRSYYLFFNYLFFNYLYMCRFSAKELDSMCRFSAKGRAFNV